MSIMDLGIATVAVITVIAFFFGEVAKSITKLDNKWIPVICGAVGALLGVAGMYTIPGFPATDILSAIAVGIVSGMAATGLHQTMKQLSGAEKEVE